MSAAGQPSGYGLSLQERLNALPTPFAALETKIIQEIRVALPGIIQTFDAMKQTATVMVAITQRVRQSGVSQPVAFPILADVPISLPRAGGFSLTLPITQGDECLVVFADFNIDAWFQSGGQQNQITQRAHALSDCFAIMGIWSQPRVLTAYSTTDAQLRSDDGTVVIDVASNAVKVTAPIVTVSAQTANIDGSTTVVIDGNNSTKIDGKTFLTHTHSGVTTGGGDTGPVA